MRRLLGKVGAWYTGCLERAPYATNCLTGFIVASAGDVACQLYLEQPTQSTIAPRFDDETVPPQHNIKIDKVRAAEMGLIRASLITPFTQYWYKLLLSLSPRITMVSVLRRVAIDQAVGSPIVILMVFGAKAFLAGELTKLPTMVENNLFSTWLCGFKYWSVMHSVNFRFVPLMYQPLFATAASLYWNAVLSYYSNTKRSESLETHHEVGSQSIVAVIDT